MIELNTLLAKAYKDRLSPDKKAAAIKELKTALTDDDVRQVAASEIARMTAIIKKRGVEACHLTSVYRDLLEAALKE